MAADAFAECIRRAAARYRVRIPPDAVPAMAAYLAELERWNRAVSLTSIRDRYTLALRYVVEAAAALPGLAGAGPRLLDAGTGGGCPGVPLKILEPDRDLVLVEANGRKAAFLREVIDVLQLEGAEVLEGRLEQLVSDGAVSDPVQTITARAWTSGWGNLLGTAATLMPPGGRALLLIGEDTLRALRRHLAAGDHPARSADPNWRAAARAQWQLRKVLSLPHLDHGYAVTLELPGEGRQFHVERPT